MSESTNDVFVRGLRLDAQTRCAHWHSSFDIVAIQFKCCDGWYACFECHNATADHAAERWPASEFHEKAILCGACRSELTINEYLGSDSTCPRCGAAFNPACSKHYDLYFAMD